MKIAYIYDAVYPWVKGGAEKRVYEIAKRLARRGHEVHWYGLKWWYGDWDIYLDGIHIHGIGKWDHLYVNGRRSIKEGLYFGYATLKGLRGKFDIIDCQEFPYFSCFSAKLHSMFNNSKLAITYYEMWGNYWYEYLGKKGFFGKLIERLTVKLPDVAIPISDKIKEDLKKLGVPERIIRVVPNGVDFYRLNEIKASDESFDVIYVGRLISHKNIDMLLKALYIVKKEVKGVSCGIIGDGPEMGKLKSLTKDLNLEENVKFFGFVEDDSEVYSHMKSSKIFVLPSSREGFPNTILEANNCGLPVIIVRHEKNAAIGVVTEGYNGFIVSPSPHEIAKKIIYLLQNEDSLSELSKNAVSFAKGYDWSIIVKKLEEVYGEIL